MIINTNDSHNSLYIKQHVYSQFYGKKVYLVMPHLYEPDAVDLACFILMDKIMLAKPITEYIPQNILDQVYAKELILAFDLSFEALYRHIDIIYNVLICKNNLPESQILIISAAKQIEPYIISKSKELKKLPCNYEFFNYFEANAHNNLTQELLSTYKSPLINRTFAKKYINFNKQWRHHRVALITLLSAYNLIDKGFNSFRKPNNYGIAGRKYNFDTDYMKAQRQIHEEVEYHPTLKIAKKYTVVDGYVWRNACPNDTIDDIWDVYIKECKEKFVDSDLTLLLDKGYNIYKQIPLIVDDQLKHVRGIFVATNVTKGAFTTLAHFYHKSYFSVVTETQFSNDRCVDISEKTYKAITFKHPFIVASTPLHLQYLRNLGYKTFSPYIDESYDLEFNDAKRLLLICKEINRLSNLSEDELLEFRTNLLEIVDYNFNLLYSRTNFIH